MSFPFENSHRSTVMTPHFTVFITVVLAAVWLAVMVLL